MPISAVTRVTAPGTRLEQGATYVDLRDPGRGEFTATGGMAAGPDDWYVAKDTVDYQLWNRLIGVRNPEHFGETNDRQEQANASRELPRIL
jgi:hypothetical protein